MRENRGREREKRGGGGKASGRKVGRKVLKSRKIRGVEKGWKDDGKVSSLVRLGAPAKLCGQWRNAAEPLLETRYMHGAPRRYKGAPTPANPPRSSVSPSLRPPLHNYPMEASSPLDRTTHLLFAHANPLSLPLSLQLCLIWFYLLTRNPLPDDLYLFRISVHLYSFLSNRSLIVPCRAIREPRTVAIPAVRRVNPAATNLSHSRSKILSKNSVLFGSVYEEFSSQPFIITFSMYIYICPCR